MLFINNVVVCSVVKGQNCHDKSVPPTDTQEHFKFVFLSQPFSELLNTSQVMDLFSDGAAIFHFCCFKQLHEMPRGVLIGMLFLPKYPIIAIDFKVAAVSPKIFITTTFLYFCFNVGLWGCSNII